MTNKPIIVDGVDVSGCDFLAKEDDYCSYSGEYRAYKGQCGCSDEEMCKDHPNCFYKKALKQLQRKAQECEQLKDELATYGATGICETCTEKSILQNDKYIKALREIKEIAEKAKKDICNNCGWKNTDSCDAEDYTCGEFIKILQKISEVKE